MDDSHQTFDSKRASHLHVILPRDGDITEIVQYAGSDLVTVFCINYQCSPLSFGRFIEILNDATRGNSLPLSIFLQKDRDGKVRVKVNVTEVIQNGIKHSRWTRVKAQRKRMLRYSSLLNYYNDTLLQLPQSLIAYLSTGRMGRIMMCSPEGRVKLQSIHRVNLTSYYTSQVPLPISSLPPCPAFLGPDQWPNPCTTGPFHLNMYSFRVHSRVLLVTQTAIPITSTLLASICTVIPFFVLICLDLFPCLLFCCIWRGKEFHKELVHT